LIYFKGDFLGRTIVDKGEKMLMKVIKCPSEISSSVFWPLFTLILMIITGPIGVAQSNNYPLQVTELSITTNENHISAIQVIGELCYLSDHGNGLKIYNISNPRDPKLLGQTVDSGIYHDMCIEGSLAFFADLEDGLVIFDVSDPRHPVRVGSYDVGEQNAAEVYVSEDLVYLAEFGDNTPHGLEIFNASDPTNITKLGDYRGVTLSYCVQTVGNYCYITGAGLTILDVSNPANPELLGEYVDNDRVRYFYINNNRAYVTCWDNGFKIIDVSDPANPELLGQYTDLGITIYVHQLEEYVFIAEWEEGLTILDVSDPTTPLFTYEYTSRGGISAVYATADYVFVGAMNTLIILEILSNESNQSTPYYFGVFGLIIMILIRKRKEL